MKVLVIDTVGNEGFYEGYTKYFPGVKITGHEPKRGLGMPHPHGFQCGYYAGVLLSLLPADQTRELCFARIFDADAMALEGSMDWLLEVIRESRPDVISRSWGLWDSDNPRGDMTGRVAYGAWTEKYRALQPELGFVDFGAAGNSDENDSDVDLDYPQQLMPDVCNIIGSAARGGKPSRFSGDGPGLQCLFWGQDVPLLTNGFWQRGSGTSFATPKAAGLCAALGLDHARWRALVAAEAARPPTWTGPIPHPKWGWGNMEHAYQTMLARLPEALKPPRRTLSDPKAARLAGVKGGEFWEDFRAS